MFKVNGDLLKSVSSVTHRLAFLSCLDSIYLVSHIHFLYPFFISFILFSLSADLVFGRIVELRTRTSLNISKGKRVTYLAQKY